MRCNILKIFLYTTLLSLVSTCFALDSNPILPVPHAPKVKGDQLSLGRLLYIDTLFSKDLSHSCYSCHSLKKAGTDNLPRYIGIDNKVGMLNTPTVLNSSLNFKQFWDGRATTLEEVIDDHIQDKTIFDNNWPTILQNIKKNAFFKDLFKRNFKDGITPTNVKSVLTLYLKQLLTPNSSFDQYLNGDKKALTDDQLKGYEIFKKYGCITCHEGPNMGGNIYQKFGIYKDYFATKKEITTADLGLYNITKKPEDKYVFKVPSLRNIALTGPYLHDGSVKTLEEAIQLMGIYEVGQPIPNYELPFIVKFLESLTGIQEN